MKRIHKALLGAAGLALAIGAAQVVMAPSASAVDLQREITIGQRVNPVTLTIPGGVDPNSVYLGSYIVNVTAGCNGCHSNSEYLPGGNPFLGQEPTMFNTACFMNGGQSFGPDVVSRNVTPISGTSMPAGLTFFQFNKALRTGKDPMDKKTLLQVMPWDTFRYMTNKDMKAVYDYLSSIPSLPTGGTGTGC